MNATPTPEAIAAGLPQDMGVAFGPRSREPDQQAVPALRASIANATAHYQALAEQVRAEELGAFRSAWFRNEAFGLKHTEKLSAMDGRVAEEARKDVLDYYWRGGGASADLSVCRRLARDTRAAIEAAVAEHDALTRGRPKMEALRLLLRERDGNDCWVCRHEMTDDCTIEHRQALANGGTWAFDNLVLAHRECNRDLGRLPITAKDAVRKVLEARNA